MKLNNKGFAVSTFMYMILLLAMILILATLGILSSRRMIIDRQKNTALDKISQTKDQICTAVSGVKSIELGTEYTCEVKDSVFYNFYVLSIEGDKINLIMNSNICEDGSINYTNSNNYCRYKWYDDGGLSNIHLNDITTLGPVVAMTKLYSATKDWKNVLDINLSGSKVYIDEGNNYGKIVTSSNGVYITEKNVEPSTMAGPTILYDTNMPLKARLPKHSELYSTTDDRICKGDSSGACPAWLVNNLRYNNLSSDKYALNSANTLETAKYNIQGYWQMSSKDDSSAYAVKYTGVANDGTATSKEDYYGVRPVITVTKSMLK